MGKVHVAYRQVGRNIPAEHARQHAMVAAGIQHETRAQHIRIAAFLLHHQFGEIAMVVEGFHRGAELHGYALLDGFVDQDFIETGTLHIECGGWAGGEFIGEFEAGIAFAPGESEAVFILKAESGLHGGQEAGLVQQLYAVRQ